MNPRRALLLTTATYLFALVIALMHFAPAWGS